jgi:hypothetical protein
LAKIASRSKKDVVVSPEPRFQIDNLYAVGL